MPGIVVGGFFGWLVIRPVNAVLGWLFRGFNRIFDGMTVVYGWIGWPNVASVAPSCYWATADWSS